jgi:hypothetical protein
MFVRLSTRNKILIHQNMCIFNDTRLIFISPHRHKILQSPTHLAICVDTFHLEIQTNHLR